MQPSGKYVFEDVSQNGFNYKRTVSNVGALYPLYSELDKSIAYTLPQMESYRTMTPMLINKNFPQRSYVRGVNWQEHYSSSPGGTLNKWCTIGQVHGNSDDDASCVMYWTFADDSVDYYFNGNEGNAVIGTNTFKFVSGFDISHVIFNVSIKGYTKAQYDAYKTDGSNQSETDITLQDIIEHPENYIISRFGIGAVAYWDSDNNTWRSGSPVKLICIIDGGSLIQGFDEPNHILFGDQTTVSIKHIGINRGGAYHLFCSTQDYVITDSTQYSRFGGIPVGLNTNNPYSLGTKDEWYIKPHWDNDEMTNYIQVQTSATSGNTNNPDKIFTASHGEMYGYDNFNTSKKGSGYSNVPGAYYYSKFDKYLTAIGYADKLSQFLASAGCYFHIGAPDSNYKNILNNDGVTPDTLHLEEDIGLGVMADDGTTTGTWIIGEDIEDYQGINKNGDVVHPDFNPDPAPPSGDDIDPYTFGGGSKLGGADSLWLLTTAQLEALHTAMVTNNDPNFEPLQSFISVMGLAIPPTYPLGDDISTLAEIKIKKADGTAWSSGVSGHLCTSQKSAFGLTGNIGIQRRYNSFLDYPPYASHEIFIPLCGWLSLPSFAIGRTLSLYYVPDVQTCAVRALVFADGCLIGEKYGAMGANIPFTSNGHGLMLGGVISGGVQLLADFATVMGGVALDNPLLAITGGTNFAADGANLALAANQNRTSVIGQNQDRTAFSDGTEIRIKSTYHKIKEDPLFGHTHGYACCKSGTLNSFHGFTVCENPHVNINCTSVEREEITKLLQEGVILP